MGVSDWSGSLLAWEGELSSWKARLTPIFGRREVRETGEAFLDDLLSGIERKTGWMMAEQAGLARPWRMQGLLGRSRWDAEVLVEEVRSYVVEALGSADGVLVVDETGFLKKGRHSVGVARQYSGTAGRIENCQVGVFLGYAGPLGQALIDRRLYLPRDWAGDAERRAAVGVPEDIPFATKPVIAAEIARALASGLPCAWVLADAVYGSDACAACWKRVNNPMSGGQLQPCLALRRAAGSRPKRSRDIGRRTRPGRLAVPYRRRGEQGAEAL